MKNPLFAIVQAMIVVQTNAAILPQDIRCHVTQKDTSSRIVATMFGRNKLIFDTEMGITVSFDLIANTIECELRTDIGDPSIVKSANRDMSRDIVMIASILWEPDGDYADTWEFLRKYLA